LIELVVVLAIIAALAGLVIPQVGMLGRSTDMAASAKTQSDLANNLQLFFTLQKRFPQGLDSLITTDGDVYGALDASGSSTTSGDLQVVGLPAGGADGTRLEAQLQPFVIDNSDDSSGTGGGGSYRSFSRCGFDFVYNHDVAVRNSNNSGTTLVSLASGMTVAEVVPGGTLAAKLLPNPADQALHDSGAYHLIALGIGPRNAAISKTLTNAPIYPGADGRYYGRYVAIFKTSTTGERATFVGVIDSYGRHPDYTQQQFNESLPDGGRQG
jgi:type II secretory pathway pseudopilin PulG